MASPEECLIFYDTLAAINKLFPNIAPDQYNMSTMTVLAECNTRVDLSKLVAVEEITTDELLLDTGSIHPSCPSDTLKIKWQKERQKKVGEFGNQLTLCYESWSKRSIKVFSKGGIHMTGVKNLTEFTRIGNVICGLLFAVGAVDERMSLSSPRIVMLNFNFSMNCELSLKALAEVMLERYNVVATHETESHPAMMVEFRLGEEKATTAMIFRSGKVLITSSSQLSGVLAAFRLICQAVSDQLDRVKANIKIKTYYKKKAGQKRFLEGYPAGQALACFPLWKRSCSWEDVVVNHNRA